VTGKLQSESGVIHIVAERMDDLTPMLGLLSESGATIGARALAHADEVRRPQMTMAQKRQGNRFAQPPTFEDPRAPPALPLETADAARALPAGRNFH
jgi:error-prone DNA polymerase